VNVANVNLSSQHLVKLFDHWSHSDLPTWREPPQW